MKKTIGILFLFLSLTAICFAQSNYTESLTITTYYPAPYGVYRNLRLHPSEEPQGSARQPGVMYFDRFNETLYILENTTRGFVPVGGAASAGDALVFNLHTKGDCKALGGNVTDTDVSAKQCRFDLPACPSGWAQYKQYNTQELATTCSGKLHGCFGNAHPNCGTNCTTAPRPVWDNVLSTCSYTQGFCYTYPKCSAAYCPCGTYSDVRTCIGNFSQIGCY